MPLTRLFSLSLVPWAGALALAAASGAPDSTATGDSSAVIGDTSAAADTSGAARDSGAVTEGKPAVDPLRLGERTYMKNCATCHRADGRGGLQPTATGDPAPNFREPAFWDGKTDEALRKVTEDGVPNSSMVAWKGILSSEEITAVTRFVRHRFAPRGAAVPQSAAPADSTAPADTAAPAATGGG